MKVTVKLWSRLGLEKHERYDIVPEVLVGASRKAFVTKYGHEPTDIRIHVEGVEVPDAA